MMAVKEFLWLVNELWVLWVERIDEAVQRAMMGAVRSTDWKSSCTSRQWLDVVREIQSSWNGHKMKFITIPSDGPSSYRLALEAVRAVHIRVLHERRMRKGAMTVRRDRERV